MVDEANGELGARRCPALYIIAVETTTLVLRMLLRRPRSRQAGFFICVVAPQPVDMGIHGP